MYYSSIVEKIKNFVAKFAPYLEDIRRRMYGVAIVFAIFFVIGIVYTSTVLRFIVSFFDIQDVIISTTSPFQFADLSLNIGLLTAFVVSCPLAVYHIFTFLRPALTAKEKRLFIMLIPVAIILFVFGFFYGFAIMYYALIVLAEINTHVGIQNIWDIGVFLSQIILTSTLLGVLFQFPLVFTFIIKTGVITVEFLKQKRRIAVLVIFIFTALLPPTDGISLLAMALPLVLLYEATIFVNSKMVRVKEAHSIEVISN